MQQRRFRPGDVLDDYCPRERRITDHAVVAMIDDRIKQTRCVVCDAEHEYKEGKLPPQRRKRPQAALFSQVLDGLQGTPQPIARVTPLPDPAHDHNFGDDDSQPPVPALPAVTAGNGRHSEPVIERAVPAAPVTEGARAVAGESTDPDAPVPPREEGPVRRPLIRATLPRPEGQPVVTRALPEFTIRQPHNPRGGQRPGGRRRGGGQQQQMGQGGHASRFGRGGQGQQRSPGGRPHGAQGRPAGPRRRGKKR